MKEKSLLYTFEALLNSLLREVVELESIQFSDDEHFLNLTLNSNEKLRIEVTFHSILGKHQYGYNHFLNDTPISIGDSLNRVINFSCNLLEQEDEAQISDFKARITQSQKNIEVFLSDLSEGIEQEYKKPLDFIEAESLLILGHSFHPYPKARDGFNHSDFKQYSPEYRSGFSLAWAVANKDVIVSASEKNFDDQWMNDIARSCLGDEVFNKISGDEKVLMPVHPWQLTHLQNNKEIKDLVKAHKVKFIHFDSEVLWFSTSSIRSIYSKKLKYMLKFSMSLRLTNSIRHLQQVEVDRGIQVCDVFNSPQGRSLEKKWPNFEVLHEPAYAAFKTKDNETLIESIVSCRVNPFTEGLEREAILLASLNQLSPNGTSLLDRFTPRENSSYYLEWFKVFTKIVITPLMDAQANFGIFLGAHQQNIIINLDKNGFPVKLYFRDCQGTGYSEEAFNEYAPYCPGLALDNGNILSKELGQKIFCYYLIINTAFDTITHLSKLSGRKELDFIEILNKSLRELKDNGVKDSSCIDYLLNDQYLWVKGNYKCCLKEINENTMKSPTDIYIPMVNPISGRCL